MKKLNAFYNSIINIGIDKDSDEFYNNTIILNNLNWLYFTIIISFFGIIGTIYNIKYSGLACLFFVLSYGLVLLTSYLKKINLSKNINLFLLTSYVFVSSVIYGPESNLIFFYFPILVLVFFLYTVKDRMFIVIHFLMIATLFLVYIFKSPYLETFAYLKSEANFVSTFIMPFQITNLFLILFFGFKRNNDNEHKIIQQKKYFEKILNTIPIEIVVMDGEFKYQFVNKTAIKDDETRNWIIGKTDYDYVYHRNKDLAIADTRFEMYKQVEKYGYMNIDEIIDLPNGKKKYTNKTLLLLNDNEIGDNLKYIGFSLDTTLKQEAEVLLKQYMIKLEKSNEEIKQFAYITSHDLKSPLRNINSLLQLTKKKNENVLNEDSKELIDSCIKSANYLYNVVSDVLLYTTSEVDKTTFSLICLNEVVQEVLKNINNIIKERNANVVLVKEFPQIYSHKTMMFNLFSNLIQNGIKYNKSANPNVIIDYKETATDFHFSVSDNGIGIDERYKEQIFIVFKRLHNQNEYEGTGIGLSICKQIVENLGGQIHVESTLNEGSTFYFNIPKN